MGFSDTQTGENPMADAINWFEIPVRDLDRATRFYEAMLGKKLKRETLGDIGGPGHIAVVVDTEGNRVGLHAHRS